MKRNPRIVTVLTVTPTFVTRDANDELADEWCDKHHCMRIMCGCQSNLDEMCGAETGPSTEALSGLL